MDDEEDDEEDEGDDDDEDDDEEGDDDEDDDDEVTLSWLYCHSCQHTHTQLPYYPSIHPLTTFSSVCLSSIGWRW